MSYANLAFFQEVTPPEEWRQLHETFVGWQQLGVDTLQETLDHGTAPDQPLSQRYLEASRRFADALAAASK